ncbi:hypothetical protein, partial [Thiolapillus sp.]|uniref:hypothetical protein n=1 Tax=Thiolapillus sp. TaxID=2017437 RepID=UPI003AF7E752
MSDLSGTESEPIRVLPVPGKPVIIDTTGAASGSGLRINGSWVQYFGLEVRSRDVKRETQEDGSSPADITLRGGVDIYGKNNKVINFIAHDNAGGINAWYKGGDSEDTEIYGSIIYNNGWTAPGRGHGHAIYAQNRGGVKRLTNNIIFFGFGTGIHVYTEKGAIDNFSIQDNVWFLAGASDPRNSQKKDNCLVGGYQPVRNLLIRNNLGYSDNGRGTRVGYGGSITEQTALLENNYLDENLWVAGHWDRLDIKDTTVLHGITGSSQSEIRDLGGNDFRETSDPPTGRKIVVSKNRYDPGRARIVVYNYDENDLVAVDLGDVLEYGAAYRIHSVFDLFGEPLVSGVYDGLPVSIPMGSVLPPQPNGLHGIDLQEDDPKKRFGVFIVTHAACIPNYTLSTSSSAGGALLPPVQHRDQGAIAEFVVRADAGYRLDSISGCNGALNGDRYVTGKIDRCQPWRAKRRLVDPSSREAALFSRCALRQRENKVGLRTRRPVIWEPSTEQQRACEVVAQCLVTRT